MLCGFCIKGWILIGMPEGWSKNREVSLFFEKSLTIEKISSKEAVQFKEMSPNKAYSFEIEESANPIISIYAEKDHFTMLKFKKVYMLLDTKWVNEKLIFMRIMWGRLLTTDAIFDVEKDEFIYSESAMDGGVAFSQWKEGCKRLGGCQCVEKE